MSAAKNSLPQQNYLAIVLWVLGIVAFLFGAVFFLSKSFNTTVDFDQNSITFFYGNTCPHCKIVEDFLSEEKVDDKIQFSRKEIYNSAQNKAEFDQAVKLCQLNPSQVGVPFLYAKGDCFFGSPDVIEYFKQYVGEGS